MKKILFIMNNLHCGGAEKALVSLLQQMDYSQYEVDLYLFQHEGLFLKQLPAEVNLLPPPAYYSYFDMQLKKAVVENIKAGRFKVAFYRILAGLVYKTEKIKARKEQKVWKYLSQVIPSLPKKYDAAIGYLEKTPNYFCIDKVDAKTKIGFIHNDYNKLMMDKEIDTPYFSKFNNIFTISEQCETILKENFPAMASKFSIMYNIVSEKTLRSMASDTVEFSKKGITLVSVGRLNVQKGFDIAIKSCKILVDNGLDVYWYVLGEGEERKALQQQINDAHLQERFILMGIKENPYPYVAQADVYVQPSRFEGKSIAIDEAKILAKPIVVTNFPSVIDQISHLKNGYIAELNADAIATGIAEVIENTSLRNALVANLANEDQGTEPEINKLYALINQ
jgi:glycosyltransferase involved in cell wall biosynthesis